MKTVAQNRRARYDYEITDTYECGIVLTGQEVKSCRVGNVNLEGAYVTLKSGVPILKGASIAKYQYASVHDKYEPDRDRILLIKKHEIERLRADLSQKGMSLIPLEVKAGTYIKIILGFGRGRKLHDKRQRKKERDISRRLKEGREI